MRKLKVTKYIYTCSSDLRIHPFNEAPITSTEMLIALVNTVSLSVGRNKHLILTQRQSHKSPRHQAGIQDYPRAKERPKQTATAAEQLFLLCLLSLLTELTPASFNIHTTVESIGKAEKYCSRQK